MAALKPSSVANCQRPTFGAPSLRPPDAVEQQRAGRSRERSGRCKGVAAARPGMSVVLVIFFGVRGFFLNRSALTAEGRGLTSGALGKRLESGERPCCLGPPRDDSGAAERARAVAKVRQTNRAAGQQPESRRRAGCGKSACPVVRKRFSGNLHPPLPRRTPCRRRDFRRRCPCRLRPFRTCPVGAATSSLTLCHHRSAAFPPSSQPDIGSHPGSEPRVPPPCEWSSPPRE
jgi:hypothetical protein